MAGSAAAAASSAQVTPFDGTPVTSSCPSPTTTSPASASRRWAAISFALASTSLDATCTALPAVCRDREPIVPDPRGTEAVSELTSLKFSIGIPRTSLASMAKAVWWPWPWTLVPTNRLAVPSSWTSTAPYSTCSPIGAVTSTYDDSPMPSCLLSPFSRRFACSARRSSYPAAARTASSALAYSPES